MARRPESGNVFPVPWTLAQTAPDAALPASPPYFTGAIRSGAGIAGLAGAAWSLPAAAPSPAACPLAQMVIQSGPLCRVERIWAGSWRDVRSASIRARAGAPGGQRGQYPDDFTCNFQRKFRVSPHVGITNIPCLQQKKVKL